MPPIPFSRRELLTRSGLGFGAIGLSAVMQQAGLLPPTPIATAATGAESLNPLTPKQPHFPAKAKRVIHIFLNGGASHVDTFDPKPKLDEYHGRELPFNLPTERKTGAAFRSPFKFRPRGESGIEVSELFEHTAKHIDDICVIRSMHADVPNHEPSLLLMNFELRVHE